MTVCKEVIIALVLQRVGDQRGGRDILVPTIPELLLGSRGCNSGLIASTITRSTSGGSGLQERAGQNNLWMSRNSEIQVAVARASPRYAAEQADLFTPKPRHLGVLLIAWYVLSGRGVFGQWAMPISRSSHFNYPRIFRQMVLYRIPDNRVISR
jgi:hypothetical protein